VSCGRAQEFLARKKVETAELVNTKKQPMGPKEALALAGQASRIYVAKGKKVAQIDLHRDRPSPAELKALMIGPTGNLRAPTLRVGKTLLVGFHEETYKSVFK
jgi:arsenate reductase-like glutaredoxin family protein